MPSPWNAAWIGPAYDSRADIGVYVYRRSFDLPIRPKSFKVRTSADQRYRLYVNGQFVGKGPLRGDEQHWFYEEFDIAPFLKEGTNVVHAIVWSFGRWSPMAQHSARTGFVLEDLRQGEKDFISTHQKWEVAAQPMWDFAMMQRGVGEFYIDVGPGEIVDFTSAANTGQHPFEGAADMPLKWVGAHHICQAEDKGILTGSTPWMLIPRSLPDMTYTPRVGDVIIRHGFKDDHSPQAADVVLAGPVGISGPTLLDFRELLCAYPRLTVKALKGTKIKLTYAEGLWDKGNKGNRDIVTDKEFHGYQDHLVCSGGVDHFEPLWWRTFRYLLIEVEDGGLAELVSLDVRETGYPLAVESSFSGSDARIKPLWDVSIRTAKRCAGESYFDCPYYEQLQYAGDTRIQAMIGYFLGRDRSLQRQAVESLRWSIVSEGLTQSRYPSRQVQIIPPFSLWWILMLHDQYMYDRVPVNNQGVRGVLEWWAKATEEAPYWCFGDWVPGWGWGVPPKGINDDMHQQTFRLALAAAKELGVKFDHKIRKPELPFKSHHARALACLADRFEGKKGSLGPVASDAAQCTYYFKYYEHLATKSEDYLEELGPWTDMIAQGLSTFGENPEPTRSDCHAWSAHPALNFFQLIAGVSSSAPGWKKARIEPKPGKLTEFEAKVAHPDGWLNVIYDNGKLTVETPVPTDLYWKNAKRSLSPGRHDC